MNNTNSKNSTFGFVLAAKNHLANLIKNFDASKTCQKNNVLLSINKKNANIFTDVLHKNINKCISEFTFLDYVKIC